mgnify:CR=1 FL=1
MNSLSKLSKNVHNMDREALVSTCLGSLCYIRELRKLFYSLKGVTESIQYCLQQTEPSLISLRQSLEKLGLTESSGLTEETISMMSHLSSLEKEVSLDSSSKKHQEKSLRNGRSSQELK